MCRRRLVTVWSIAVTLSGVVSVFAQTTPPSLADVARQEAERRKNAEKSSKVYTNADTKSGRPLTTAAAAPAKPAPAAGQAGAGPGGAAGKDGKGAGKGEMTKEAREALLARILDLKEQISRNELQAGKVSAQMDQLNTDVLNSFDQVTRNDLLQQRDGALANFRKLQSDTEGLRKALSDLEADARALASGPK